jgi:hypothetical protein
MLDERRELIDERSAGSADLGPERRALPKAAALVSRVEVMISTATRALAMKHSCAVNDDERAAQSRRAKLK